MPVGEWRSEWFRGGHLVLDFVNTVPWRLDAERAADRLPDAGALIGWCCAAGLFGEQRADELRAEAEAEAVPGRALVVAERARGLREELYGLLQPVAVGREPPAAELGRVRQAIADAITHAEIDTVVPLRWVVAVRGVEDVPRALALSAWELLQFEDLARLRQCQDRGCGWLFLDRSKNASRRWCSSADCGNRTRARRHHARHRDDSRPPPETSSGTSR
ncbi:CGNR zinc finger domain-containing protein [Saccharopolyspora mangrovi]|uniref:CGNR zinc finger domain-containing protein n=1 Tax=Saccharopolyspora mangrovi TaxID=3082379 RepID=A0ABU6ADQ0_9PSEU|nr:CGNR zinc finger domain-containing protein [Saccharopolyspora sp. S2-29]MEB3369683.1 CGNR zinc finger domain-containing protein [Saccharopolyspora sp. S2-29]